MSNNLDFEDFNWQAEYTRLNENMEQILRHLYPQYAQHAQRIYQNTEQHHNLPIRVIDPTQPAPTRPSNLVGSVFQRMGKVCSVFSTRRSRSPAGYPDIIEGKYRVISGESDEIDESDENQEISTINKKET
jgi:hypothetical protein